MTRKEKIPALRFGAYGRVEMALLRRSAKRLLTPARTCGPLASRRIYPVTGPAAAAALRVLWRVRYWTRRGPSCGQKMFCADPSHWPGGKVGPEALAANHDLYVAAEKLRDHAWISSRMGKIISASHRYIR